MERRGKGWKGVERRGKQFKKKNLPNNVLTVALFSCLEMMCEFRHLKFFKLLWDHVNLLNQLYWYLFQGIVWEVSVVIK